MKINDKLLDSFKEYVRIHGNFSDREIQARVSRTYIQTTAFPDGRVEKHRSLLDPNKY